MPEIPALNPNLRLDFSGGQHGKLNLATAIQSAVKVIRPLTDEEELKYIAATNGMSSLTQAEWPFRVLELNYLDINDFAGAVATKWEQGKINHYTDYYHIGMNRRIMNFLSAAGSFLAFTKRRHKRTFGKDSLQNKRLMAAIEKARFDSFALRFVLELRNFAAHFNLPLGSLTFRANTAPDGQKIHSLVASFSKSRLLEDSSWDEGVRRELEGFDDEFDVLPILAIAMKEFSTLDDLIFLDLLKPAEPHADFLIQLAREAKGEQAIIVKSVQTRFDPPRRWNTSLNPIFVEQAEDVLAELKRGEAANLPLEPTAAPRETK